VCGRFNVLKTPGLEALLTSLGCDPGALGPMINVAPTEPVPLIRRAQGQAALDQARWWLTPGWARELSQKYAMFNARCEGLANSPAFRKPFARQRGIVPMSSFIEWRGAAGSKQPWLITTRDEALAVAALWDVWRGSDDGAPLLSCTLVTTEAAEAFRPWHNRMPVVLHGEEQERWLDNDRAIDTGDPIFFPVIKAPLRLVPIARGVGNARNKAAEVLEPDGEVVELPADNA
jgi:putative SOS response-associated peptidase YedK